MPDLQLRPMFTKGGKEPFAAASISKDAVSAVDPRFTDRLKPAAEIAAADASSGTGVAKPAPGTAPAVSPPTSPSTGAAKQKTLPVPDEEAQQKSMALFREIYHQEYEDAKTSQQKYDLAKKLADKVTKLRDDPSGRYVLLTVAGKVAAEAGDVTTALAVADQLIAGFDVKPFDVKADALMKAAKQTPRSKACNDKLIDEGKALLALALLDDNFILAHELHALALAAARRGKDKDKIDDLATRRRDIELARLSYAKVEKVVDSLRDDPENPESNLTVGRYFCFIKRNWVRGLPMLAQGSDDSLKRLARQELSLPINAEQQTQLADAWWERALREREKDGLRREIHLRAVHWYLIAMPRLPEGLLQVKVEVRIKDAEKTYGKDVVEPIRQALRTRPS